MTYDTIIRGGTVVTASDSFVCEIGIAGGRIVALADHLDGGTETIDATGTQTTHPDHCGYLLPVLTGSVPTVQLSR